MMDVYLSEEEQWQKIKEWWKKYSNSILIGLVLCILISYGWRYWHVRKTTIASQASVLYMEVINSEASHKDADVKLFAERLIKEYGSTPYAAMTSFILARNAVVKGKSEEALNYLKWVVANSKNRSFRQIARVRGARVLLAMKKIEEALDLLKKVDDTAYDSVIAEEQGDIYLAMNKKDEALSSYQRASEEAKRDGVTNPILQIKIDQLQRPK